MYSIVMLAALGSAPAAPDVLLVRRAGAGCAGNAAVARASAGCNGGNAVALVPVQAYAAVAVNQGCNGATAAAGCSGNEARGLLGHQRRVARREARRQGAHVDNSLPVYATQLPAALPPVAAQLPAQPAVTAPAAPKATTVHPQAFLVPAPSATAVVTCAPVKVKTRTVYRAAPVRFSNCPNGNCPR